MRKIYYIILVFILGICAWRIDTTLAINSTFDFQSTYLLPQSSDVPKIQEIKGDNLTLASILHQVSEQSEIEIVFDNVELSILYNTRGSFKNSPVYDILNAMLTSSHIPYEIKTDGTIWISNPTPIRTEVGVSFEDIIVEKLDLNNTSLGDALWELSQKTGVNIVLNKVKLSTLLNMRTVSLLLDKVSLYEILRTISYIFEITLLVNPNSNLVEVIGSAKNH